MFGEALQNHLAELTEVYEKRNNTKRFYAKGLE